MSSRLEHDEGASLHNIWRRSWERLQEIEIFYSLQTKFKNVVPARLMIWKSFFFVEVDWRNLPVAHVSLEGIRKVNPSDATLLEEANLLVQPLQDYFERGARISICELNDEIVGISVYDTRSHKYSDWLQIDMTEDVIWNTRVWIAPGQRGKGLHHRIRAFSVGKLRPEGFHRSLAIVEASNVSSLRASLKGANIACACTYFRLLNFTMVWLDGRLRVGFWRSDHRLVVPSSEIHTEPGEKLGRHKVKKLQRYIFGRGN